MSFSTTHPKAQTHPVVATRTARFSRSSVAWATSSAKTSAWNGTPGKGDPNAMADWSAMSSARIPT
jgi:hypothetical protein